MLDTLPAIFRNPFNGKIETMPIEMVNAYVYDQTFLHLEKAARVAFVRDLDAANNLFASVTDQYSVSSLEGTGFDILSVEPPSLR